MPIKYTKITRTTISVIIILAVLVCPPAMAGQSQGNPNGASSGKLLDLIRMAHSDEGRPGEGHSSESPKHSDNADVQTDRQPIDKSVVAADKRVPAYPSQSAANGQPYDFTGLAVAGPSPVEIVMQPDAAGYTCEGVKYSSPAPLWIDDMLFIPLRAVAEAFGASIEYIENADSGESAALAAGGAQAGGAQAGADSSPGPGTAADPVLLGLEYPLIKGVFMGNTFFLSMDMNLLALNGELKELPGRVRYVDNNAYVPMRAFDMCLGVKTSYDSEQNTVSIRLEDDGGVRDFSKLIDEIFEGAIGHSYFDWRLDIPSKSMLVSISPNGDYIMIYSPLVNAIIEITVKPSSGNDTQYYIENPDEISDEYYALSAHEGGSGSSSYVQAIMYNYYMYSIMARLYPRDHYDYLVTILVFPDDNGMMYDIRNFMLDNPYEKILDTFETKKFAAGERGIYDLSRVVEGKLDYSHYLNISESKMLLIPWMASILPEWELIDEGLYGTRIYAILGNDYDEYLCFAIEKMPPQVTVDELFDNYEDLDAARFNAEAYKFIEKNENTSGGRSVLDITYSLSYEGDTYIFNERLIPIGDLIYRALLKVPEGIYSKDKTLYKEIFESFEAGANGLQEISNELEKQASALQSIYISDSDEPADVGEPEQKWRSKLPGNWIKIDGWLSAALVGYDNDGYYEVSSGAYLNATYILHSLVSDMYSEDTSMFTSMEYAQYLMEDIEEIDIMTIEEPEPVEYDDYIFARISYTVDADPEDIYISYPGFPVSGDIYMLNDENGIYIIVTEIPYVFNTPLNRSGFEMFLSNFRAGDKYRERRTAGGAGAAGEAGGDDSAGAGSAAGGSLAGNGARRTGAVG